MKESTRAYLYRVALAGIPLLTIYGIVDDKTAAVVAGLVAAVFSTGLAAKNTSTGS